MRFFSVLYLLVGLVTAQEVISFVNPPPSGEAGDFSENLSFELGSVQTIQWSGASLETNISMVLYQAAPDVQFEYVFAQRSGEKSFRWNVATTKNISETNVFFFQIYIVGATAPSAGSHYFNLTRGPNEDDATTSKTSSITTSSVSPTQTTITTPALTTSATSTPTPIPNTSSEGLSAASKVGMGVGIPAAIIIAAAAGWFFGRRKNTNPIFPEPTYAIPSEGYYAPSAMQEQSEANFKPIVQPPLSQTPSEIYTRPIEPTEMPANLGYRRY